MLLGIDPEWEEMSLGFTSAGNIELSGTIIVLEHLCHCLIMEKSWQSTGCRWDASMMGQMPVVRGEKGDYPFGVWQNIANA